MPSRQTGDHQSCFEHVRRQLSSLAAGVQKVVLQPARSTSANSHIGGIMRIPSPSQAYGAGLRKEDDGLPSSSSTRGVDGLCDDGADVALAAHMCLGCTIVHLYIKPSARLLQANHVDGQN